MAHPAMHGCTRGRTRGPSGRSGQRINGRVLGWLCVCVQALTDGGWFVCLFVYLFVCSFARLLYCVSEGFLVTVGVILASLSSLLVCFGLAIQKTSLCAAENENVSPWKQPKWVMGFVLMIIGNIIDFLAFGLAPQSLLAPLAALSLVWNLFVSNTVLGEEYDRTDVMACAFIFVGTGLAVIFSNHHEREYTLDTLRDLYHKSRMAWYAILTPLFLGFHYYLASIAENRKEPLYRLCGLIGWCGFAGITGGNSVLFAKSTVELLKDAFHGDDVFLHLDTYLIIFAMVVCLLTQISFLNGAMLRYDQLHVLPVYQSYWIISGVVGGLVYFGEFEELSATAINMFLFGTMITLFGLYKLTTKENHSINNAGQNTGFDVLPSRRISEDSFMGFDVEDQMIGIDLPRRNSRHSRSGSIGSGSFNRGMQARSSSVSSMDSDEARQRRSPRSPNTPSMQSIELS